MSLGDFTPIVTHPYSVGVVLAVNAVKDLYGLLDAPACALGRAGMVCGTHDITSTLWSDSEGQHRFRVSCTTTEKLIRGNREELGLMMKEIAQVPDCGGVAVVGFPMSTLAGVAYEVIWKNLDSVPDLPLFVVKGGATTGDWLDGYAQTLLALATSMPLPKVPTDPRKVAIVGYMHDRGERDHTANLAEFRRMMSGLGLELVSVWLDGGSVKDLERVAQAGTILSFPYGRAAASLLAQRTGAQLLECDLPMGLTGSGDWLIRIGEHFGDADRARGFVEAELARLAPLLEAVVWEWFLESRVVFVGDPYLIRPLAAMLKEVGGRLLVAVGVGGAHRLADAGPFEALPTKVFVGFPTGRLPELLPDLVEQGPVHCLVGFMPNEFRVAFAQTTPARLVCVGFPSDTSHALYDRPYLGFEGTMCLLGRMLEEIQVSRLLLSLNV